MDYLKGDKYNNYDQIKWRTELEQEAALVRDFFDHDGDRFSMTQGSGGVGKGALYHRFYHDNFIDEYDPIIEDTCYERPHQIDEEPVTLTFPGWDYMDLTPIIRPVFLVKKP